jgi:hypothetical protein
MLLEEQVVAEVMREQSVSQVELMKSQAQRAAGSLTQANSLR